MDEEINDVIQRMGSMSSVDSYNIDDYRLETNTSSSINEFEIAEPRRKKRKVLTSGLLSALDRTGTTSESAAYIIAETAVGLGHKLDDIVVSTSTIWRKREEHQIKVTLRVKKELQSAEISEVYFDGKILQDIVGKEKVDRFPVVVTGVDTSHLLGVPKLASGTGVNQVDAVIEILSEWGSQDKIGAMCFDTRSTNTGIHNGTCTLLEAKLGRNLLWLPCRHHIHEIILRCVFEIHFGKTSGPNVAIFEPFAKSWASIDQKNFEHGLRDEFVMSTIAEDERSTMTFLLDELNVTQPRDDYKAMLELAFFWAMFHLEELNSEFQAQRIMHDLCLRQFTP